jgi:hypothetical protein
VLRGGGGPVAGEAGGGGLPKPDVEEAGWRRDESDSEMAMTGHMAITRWDHTLRLPRDGLCLRTTHSKRR